MILHVPCEGIMTKDSSQLSVNKCMQHGKQPGELPASPFHPLNSRIVISFGLERHGGIVHMSEELP